MNNTNLIFSLIAFALSFLAFFGTKGQITELSALSLIAICTTLIVGVSVVDAMRLKEVEDQLKELKSTKNELESLKNEICELKLHANISLDANWGATLYDIQPRNAIVESWKAITLCFSHNETKRIKTCIVILDHILSKIEKSPDLIRKLKAECKNKMPIEIREAIRNSEDYIDYKERLEDLIDKTKKVSLTQKT